ncbi:hypothetical protein LTS10_012040 [Elasticomyces elasticus]|nr:hypothetical protein LTS10_012040 [Elasticomyces elasticus]
MADSASSASTNNLNRADAAATTDCNHRWKSGTGSTSSRSSMRLVEPLSLCEKTTQGGEQRDQLGCLPLPLLRDGWALARLQVRWLRRGGVSFVLWRDAEGGEGWVELRSDIVNTQHHHAHSYSNKTITTNPSQPRQARCVRSSSTSSRSSMVEPLSLCETIHGLDAGVVRCKVNADFAPHNNEQHRPSCAEYHSPTTAAVPAFDYSTGKVKNYDVSAGVMMLEFSPDKDNHQDAFSDVTRFGFAPG